MSFQQWRHHLLGELRGENPLAGNCLPTRVALFGRGRSTILVPLPWNYKEPIKISEVFCTEADQQQGWGRYNRFEKLTNITRAGRAEGLGLWEKFESTAPDKALRSNIRVFLAGAMEATNSFAGGTISRFFHRPQWLENIYKKVRDMNTASLIATRTRQTLLPR
jgi:hypothetical protein